MKLSFNPNNIFYLLYFFYAFELSPFYLILTDFFIARGRLKSKKNTGFNSSSLEVYLNHQVKTHISNGNSSRSSTSSPTQPGNPQALCSTVDNQPKITCLPVDLNEKRKLEKTLFFVWVLLRCSSFLILDSS